MPLISFSVLRDSLNADAGVLNSIGPYCIIDGPKSDNELLAEIESILKKGLNNLRRKDFFDFECGKF